MQVLEQRGIGDNKPPSLFSFATETMLAISDWMKERPQISNEEEAREAKLLLDHAKNCAADLEAERVKLVTPLNDQIDTINTKYKTIHNKDARRPGIFDRVVNELKERLGAFIAKEEERRQRELEVAQRKAQEAENLARRAEATEREAIANSHAGELGVDVSRVVVDADRAFNDFQKAEREAARAERETHVKIGGGFMNAASLRTKETLVVVSYGKAIKAIGKNEKIEAAILSAARDYRKERGSLPDGVEAQFTRAL
jgi:hypothetical protein